MLPWSQSKGLATFFKGTFLWIVYEEETTHIVVHAGTNNLKSGLWERDAHDYVTLINTLRELFRSARITFSAILPRWDSDRSLSFNIQQQVCARLSFQL